MCRGKSTKIFRIKEGFAVLNYHITWNMSRLIFNANHEKIFALQKKKSTVPYCMLHKNKNIINILKSPNSFLYSTLLFCPRQTCNLFWPDDDFWVEKCSYGDLNLTPIYSILLGTFSLIEYKFCVYFLIQHSLTGLSNRKTVFSVKYKLFFM